VRQGDGVLVISSLGPDEAAATHLAAVLGISEQAVSIFETTGTDTALVVLQRYARGLARCARRTDAHLHVRLHDS